MDKFKLKDQEEWAMQQLEKRRCNRNKLKAAQCLEGMTKEDVLRSAPETMDTEQWSKLVDYWFDEDV